MKLMVIFFLLFIEIEKAMQVKLMSYLEKGTIPPSEQSSGKEEILQHIMSDSNVLFYWVIMSYSIQDDGTRSELLTHITRTLLFLHSSQWMEQYKHMSSADSKKKKGLQKELKKLC